MSFRDRLLAAYALPDAGEAVPHLLAAEGLPRLAECLRAHLSNSVTPDETIRSTILMRVLRDRPTWRAFQPGAPLLGLGCDILILPPFPAVPERVEAQRRDWVEGSLLCRLHPSATLIDLR